MKKILISIFVSVIGLLSFGYCGFLIRYSTDVNYLNISSNSTHTFNSVFCFYPSGGTCRSNMKLYDENGSQVFDGLPNNYFCVGTGYSLVNNHTSTCSVSYYPVVEVVLNGGGGNCPDCPSQYTSEECQQEYSLMPISSCDSEYCQLNELCGTGSSGSGDLQWSSLFINGIQHVGGSIIDVTIPSEVQRNYIYTGENEDIFKLDVEGLNGDPDYIQGIIDVNSYRPTSEDFTNTFVGGLTLIFPYIIVTAFIVFIWRFIRKIFK